MVARYQQHPSVRNNFAIINSSGLKLTGFTEPPFEGLKCVFLCMTPRSGSTYLGSALRASGLGTFFEHFRVAKGALEKELSKSKATTYEGYVRSIVDRFRRKDVFGAKVAWSQFGVLYDAGAYDRYFSEASFLFLTREDMLAQAVSRYISTETGYFHSPQVEAARTATQEVPLDLHKLSNHLNALLWELEGWERFFATEGIRPLRITYEQLETNPRAVVAGIFKFVGARPSSKPLVVETEFKRVRNARHARMRAEAIEAFRANRWASAVVPAAGVEPTRPEGPAF